MKDESKPPHCHHRPLLLAALWLVCACAFAPAQIHTGRTAAGGEGNTLFGDLKVDDSQTSATASQTYHVILYNNANVVLQRQAISNGGRFRFLNVPNGEYYLVVEVDGTEAARMHLRLDEPVATDVRQDIALEWRATNHAGPTTKAAAISADDIYQRAPDAQTLFTRAQKAADKKDYAQAVALLRQVTAADAQDYQAWCELGTYLYAQEKYDDAESAYRRALEARPTYTLALVDLGRLRMARKDFNGAIEPLTRAVALPPPSAEINHLLGECYLQIKKGSKAVGYLYEALRLDPVGQADVHLRLATLYIGAGLKERAAAEYEQFLKKRPDYPGRKEMEKFIAENKRP